MDLKTKIKSLVIASAGNPAISPDGKFLAYVSSESGRSEVYVRPYPSLDRHWLVSTEGGAEPVWATNGRELFYRSGDKMMVAKLEPGAELEMSKPAILFERPYAVDPVANDAVNYDVTSDGKLFIMIEEEQASPGWNVVLNWAEELKRLVPTSE